MPEPRGAKSKRTRNKIFDAAADLMKEHGEQYVTIANICEAADISKGTFFYHFKSKDELLRYYLLERFDDYLIESNLDESEDDDVYRLILGLFHSYTSYCQEAGIEFISAYYTPTNKALDMNITMASYDKMNILMRKCVDALEDAVRKGYVRADWGAQKIAFDCCSVEKGCVFEWCAEGGSFDLQARVDHMMHCYFRNVVTQKYLDEFSFEEPPAA